LTQFLLVLHCVYEMLLQIDRASAV